MIFSILISILLLIIIFVIWKIKTRPKYLLSFVETGSPRLESYRPSKKTKNKYFSHPDGIIDLSKHKEYLRFREITGDKEYLVEPWGRTKNLYIEEGKTKAIIFEFVKDQQDKIVAVIPCLRLIETLLEEENNNPLLGYKETYLGVYWDGKRKMVKSDYLLGIVKYESV